MLHLLQVTDRGLDGFQCQELTPATRVMATAPLAGPLFRQTAPSQTLDEPFSLLRHQLTLDVEGDTALLVFWNVTKYLEPVSCCASICLCAASYQQF